MWPQAAGTAAARTGSPAPLGGAAAPALPQYAAEPAQAMFRLGPTHRGRSPFVLPTIKPDVAWIVQAGGPIVSSPAVAADGAVLFGSHDGRLYSVGRDGATKWMYATGDIIFGSPAVAHDGTIYIGSDDDHLYAVKADGTLAWKLRLGACDPKGFGPESSRCDVDGGPTIGPDGTIYVASHEGSLFAIDASGKIKWSFKTNDRSWSTPAVAQDGTIYFGSDDDHLYAVKPEGSLKWKLHLGDCDPKGFGPESSRCDVDGGPTIGPDGTIYVGGDGIHAVWPDGTLRWKVATAEHVASTPALAPDGTVYAGSQDDALYAIAPDGTKKWEVRTGGDIDAAPAIAADGTIYVGSDDKNLYAITPAGQIAWKVVTGADVRGGAAIGADGTIYVGSDTGILYAVGP